MTQAFRHVGATATRVYRGGGWQRSAVIAPKAGVVQNYVPVALDVLSIRLVREINHRGEHDEKEG